jgi:hypothetical protein
MWSRLQPVSWRHVATSLSSLVLLALLAPPALSQPAAPTKKVALTALGGASLTTPDYREVRKDAAVVVLEQLPEPAQQKTFRVLVLAIEEGPTGPADAIPWDKVKDNVVSSAGKSGRTLTLAVGEPFADSSGFAGRRLVGELAAPNGKKVAIELVALVKDEKLVTIGMLAEAIGAAERTVLDGIAKTVKLGN